MPMRRKIIHDTSSSSSPPRLLGHQVPGFPAQSDPSDHSSPPAAKLVRRAAEGRVEIVVISSDDSEPVSPQHVTLDQAQVLPVWNPLLFAAQHGHFPSADDVPLVVVPAANAADHDGDDGYLWNAVPAHVSQFLDLEATCMDDTSSGSSDGSDGELSPGFIDDVEAEKENITAADVELLQRMFPHTYQCVCDTSTIMSRSYFYSGGCHRVGLIFRPPNELPLLSSACCVGAFCGVIKVLHNIHMPVLVLLQFVDDIGRYHSAPVSK